MWPEVITLAHAFFVTLTDGFVRFPFCVCVFVCVDGPQAMLRGAVLYGGLMYVLSGGLGGPKRTPFAYEEQAVEF